MSELKLKIEGSYWDFLLESGKQPESVYSFCKKYDFSEKEFYQHFGSFEALESHFWKWTVVGTQEVLDADADYQTYDAKGKLLAFFYTYFERSLEFRSRFLKRFPRKDKALICKNLKSMKEAFDDSAKLVMDKVLEEGTSAIPAKITEESYRGGWPVFLFILNFWLEDTSEGFQDTDSLIEKMVRLGHEVTHINVFDSAFDLGRFLFGRFKK